MADTRGVFGLRLTGLLKSKGEWVPLPEVWHGSPTKNFVDGAAETPDTGYVGGGTPSSIVDKISFSSDTTARIPGGNLSAARYRLAACSSFTAGYFGGGEPGPKSTVDKLTYSSDTTAYTPSANINTPIASHAAIGNGTLGFGYFAGGTPSTRSQVYKITFSNDTNINLESGCQLTESKYGLGAVSSPTNAYFAGGHVSNYATSVDKIEYASNTVERIPGANLDTSRAYFGASSSSTAGYFSGGSSSSYRSNTERLTFSTETNALLPASSDLATGNSDTAGSTGNLSAGYFCGGRPSSRSYVNKLSYSDETQARIPGANLSAARYALAGTGARTYPTFPTPPTPTPSGTIFQEGPNIGYIMGGLDAPGDNRISSTDKLNFSTDTTTLSPSANSTFSGVSESGATHSTSAGYRGGGRVNGGTPSSRVEKLTFSSESIALVPTAGNLSSSRYNVAGTSSPAAGYFGGGDEPSSASRMDKLTFSDDTTTLTPGANLTSAKGSIGAAGNTTHGYFGGGRNPSNSSGVTTMDKLNYTNDTTAAVPGAALTGARYLLSAIGNDTQGYFGGGNPGPNGQITDKLTYATDTTAATPSALVGSGERLQYATTGNIENGYFCGGSYPTQSTTAKLVYSTDTATATPSAFLTVAKRTVTGTSSRMDGAGTPIIV